MIDAKYYLHGIRLPAGTWITKLNDATPAANVNRIVEYASGATSPSFRGGHGAAPDVTFSTSQVKTVLDACGLAGANLAAGNVDLYYRAGQIRDEPYAIDSASHLRIRCLQSFLYWTDLAVSSGGEASINCRLVPLFDGTNAPMVAAGSQAIPAQATVSEIFGLGPVWLNNARVYGGTRLAIALAPELDIEHGEGDDYPTWLGVRRHNPVVTITTRNLGHWATIGVAGVPITALRAYLRKRSVDSVMGLAWPTAEHIKFSATDNPAGLATVEQSSGGDPDSAEGMLRAALRISDASSAHPLTLSTAAAIV